MLLVGEYNHNIIQMLDSLDNIIIYNLCSYREGYEKLNLLPLNNIDYFDERDFDIKYNECIFNNQKLFVDFFKIVYELYIGNHIYLLVTKNEYFELIYESLLKLIQQRYGYVCHYINEIDDLIELKDNSEFSLNGLYHLDVDKNRYSTLVYIK